MTPSPNAAPTLDRARWRRTRIGATLPYLIAAAAILAGVVFLGEEVGRHIGALEAWIARLGPWAVPVFIVLYAVLGSVFVPDLLLGIVAGASFGFPRGLVAATAGSLAAAALQHMLARHLLRRRIDGIVASRPALLAIQRAVRQQEFRLQFLIRLTPLNRALTSYVFGATGVGFARFLAACVALLPSLGLEVYFGYAGAHLARMAGPSSHAAALHDAALIAGLAGAITVMVMVSNVARRAVAAATVAGQDLPE